VDSPRGSYDQPEPATFERADVSETDEYLRGRRLEKLIEQGHYELARGLASEKEIRLARAMIGRPMSKREEAATEILMDDLAETTDDERRGLRSPRNSGAKSHACN
jgi:hypothetical protein